MVEENIRKNMKKIRLERDLSLSQVAEAVQFDTSNMSKIENGKREPTINLLEKLADFYGVSLSYFFGEEVHFPKELKEVGVEWITFANNMKKKDLTPEEITKILDIIKSLPKS
jgi:transcriptional regulator with XRE-family HTH domain